MITGINECKTLTRHISCKCKYRVDGRKHNSDWWWNNNKCHCGRKKRHVCEKDYVWDPSTCNCQNGNYLASIMDDSMVICDEVIDADTDVEAKSNNEAKSYDQTNFNGKKETCKLQGFYVLLTFLLITLVLLIAITI